MGSRGSQWGKESLDGVKRVSMKWLRVIFLPLVSKEILHLTGNG